MLFLLNEKTPDKVSQCVSITCWLVTEPVVNSCVDEEIFFLPQCHDNYSSLMGSQVPLLRNNNNKEECSERTSVIVCHIAQSLTADFWWRHGENNNRPMNVRYFWYQPQFQRNLSQQPSWCQSIYSRHRGQLIYSKLFCFFSSFFLYIS